MATTSKILPVEAKWQQDDSESGLIVLTASRFCFLCPLPCCLLPDVRQTGLEARHRLLLACRALVSWNVQTDACTARRTHPDGGLKPRLLPAEEFASGQMTCQTRVPAVQACLEAFAAWSIILSLLDFAPEREAKKVRVTQYSSSQCGSKALPSPEATLPCPKVRLGLGVDFHMKT